MVAMRRGQSFSWSGATAVVPVTSDKTVHFGSEAVGHHRGNALPQLEQHLVAGRRGQHSRAAQEGRRHSDASEGRRPNGFFEARRPSNVSSSEGAFLPALDLPSRMRAMASQSDRRTPKAGASGHLLQPAQPQSVASSRGSSPISVAAHSNSQEEPQHCKRTRRSCSKASCASTESRCSSHKERAMSKNSSGSTSPMPPAHNDRALLAPCRRSCCAKPAAVVLHSFSMPSCCWSEDTDCSDCPSGPITMHGHSSAPFIGECLEMMQEDDIRERTAMVEHMQLRLSHEDLDAAFDDVIADMTPTHEQRQAESERDPEGPFAPRASGGNKLGHCQPDVADDGSAGGGTATVLTTTVHRIRAKVFAARALAGLI